ncbi:MAG: anthranilate phosphoribosyltransferase [Phycisphaerae bacterium]
MLATVVAGRDLTRAEARRTFERILSGAWRADVIGALLSALATKGECVEEVVGAAEAMRANATRIRCDTDAIDTCGTGGDGISTFNVSTTAAIIAAAAGATVAKHGNRSATRASGSTEVLARLGIDTDAPPETVARCLATARIGYLNAQRLHPAMRHAAPVRVALRTRTIFNVLGPLTNPAGARRQVVGVPREPLMEIVASALVELGVIHAWVVHGGDGLCDLTVTAETTVVEIRGDRVARFVVTPESVGLSRGRLADLLIDSPERSAAMVLRVLGGDAGAPRDHALLNAGAALVVAGIADDLGDGVRRAAEAIDSGAAVATLQQWRRIGGGASSATPDRDHPA